MGHKTDWSVQKAPVERVSRTIKGHWILLHTGFEFSACKSMYILECIFDKLSKWKQQFHLGLLCFFFFLFFLFRYWWIVSVFFHLSSNHVLSSKDFHKYRWPLTDNSFCQADDNLTIVSFLSLKTEIRLPPFSRRCLKLVTQNCHVLCQLLMTVKQTKGYIQSKILASCIISILKG